MLLMGQELQHIQTDNGSEYHLHFETATKDLKLAVPRSVDLSSSAQGDARWNLALPGCIAETFVEACSTGPSFPSESRQRPDEQEAMPTQPESTDGILERYRAYLECLTWKGKQGSNRKD
jgi:hypothetical protein